MTTSDKPNFSTARTVKGSMVIRDAAKGEHIVISGKMVEYDIQPGLVDGEVVVTLQLDKAKVVRVVGFRKTPVNGGFPV